MPEGDGGLHSLNSKKAKQGNKEMQNTVDKTIDTAAAPTDGASQSAAARFASESLKSVSDTYDMMEHDVGRDLTNIPTVDNVDDLYATSFTDEEMDRIRSMAEEIDETQENVIVSFGTSAQHDISVVADQLLTGMENDELSLIEGDLSRMVTLISDVDPAGDQGLLMKIIPRRFRPDPIEQASKRYPDVKSQVDEVVYRMMENMNELNSSNKSMDVMYRDTVTLYKKLQMYIAALDIKIEKYKKRVVAQAKKAKEANKSGNDSEFMESQKSAVMGRRLDLLEQQRQSLHVAQTVAAQDLPTIMNMKDQATSLVSKVNETINLVIPMWKRKIAQSKIANAAKNSIELQNRVTDANNLIIGQGTKKIRELTAEGRRAVNRSIVDLKVLETANRDAVGMINDVLKIDEEARKGREQAKIALGNMQRTLITSVANAREKAAQIQIDRGTSKMIEGTVRKPTTDDETDEPGPL